jgi:hypothetical protein
MIEIKEMPDGSPFIISSVADFCDAMGYCEFKAKHFLKGIRPPQTKITIEGTKAHEKQEQYEREHFELVPINKEELADLTKDVECAYEAIQTRLLVPLKFGDEKLLMLIFGRADKLIRNKGMLIVEESKFPDNAARFLEKFEPYPDQKLQTLLYLNSHFTITSSFEPSDWFEIPHNEKVWIINIKNKNTGESIKIFRGIQTREAEEFLKDSLRRFALITLGKLEPKHHQNVRKCKPCRFKDCEYMIK